jgi:hypothetical protein
VRRCEAVAGSGSDAPPCASTMIDPMSLLRRRLGWARGASRVPRGHTTGAYFAEAVALPGLGSAAASGGTAPPYSGGVSRRRAQSEEIVGETVVRAFRFRLRTPRRLNGIALRVGVVSLRVRQHGIKGTRPVT